MICPNDDMGTKCKDCFCKYNPIVLIATHERKEITTININLLRNQTFIPKILIVCSTQDEFEYYKSLGVYVIFESNTPLGNKWQSGVNVAVDMKADPLIILGSDDILRSDYIKMVLTKMNQGFEFVGCSSWHSYDLPNEVLYVSKYVGENQDIPIGSGKAYSGGLLGKINGEVFNVRASKCLDDQGYRMVTRHGANSYLHREPMILAVKGGWNELNPIQAYLRAPTIKTGTANKEILKDYDYTPDSKP